MGALQRSLILNAVGVVAILALAGCGGADGVPEGADGSSGGQCPRRRQPITAPRAAPIP